MSIGGLTTALIICEVLLRLFYPQRLYSFEQNLFIESEDFGYCLTPNVEKVHSQPEYSYIIRSNSFGFRGKGPNFGADYRVLVLGDSFGMGQGVAEGRNLCALSQKHFDKHHSDVDIFNTSISGYSAVNEILVLKKFLKTYDPDLVVLLFYWNDIGVTESLFVRNGFLVLGNPNEHTAALREWMNNHSHLYSLIKKFYYVRIKEVPDTFGVGRLLPEEGINITIRNIGAMNKLCDNHDAQFVVVLLPLHGIYEGSPEFRENRQIVARLLQELLISHVDWAEVLPKTGRESLVLGLDHHWNELGHAYFSRFLTEIVGEASRNSGSGGRSR